MAKTTITTLLKAPIKPQFLAYMRQGTVTPYVIEELWQAEPWIWHGRQNLFPEYIRSLADNCGPLERCITMLAQCIAGKGVRFYDQKGAEIQAAQDLFQEWMSDMPEEDFRWRTAYDLAHGLGKSWNVRYADKGIARLDHLDRFGLRSGKIEKGTVKKYYWSSDWARGISDPTNERYAPKELRAFDWAKDANNGASATIFSKSYRPREPYYGGLWWYGGIQAAEVWVKIDPYNRVQIDTGFNAGGMLVTRVDGTEAEIEAHRRDVADAFTGPQANGLFHIPCRPGEEMPIFTPFERGNNAGDMDAIRSSSAEVIYDVFGIPSLLLRDRAEGLTSQERAIFMRLQQFMRTLVEPLQQLGICKDLTRLMNAQGVPVWETRIDQLQIFNPVQSDAVIMASATVDEVRMERGAAPAELREWGAQPLNQPFTAPAIDAPETPATSPSPLSEGDKPDEENTLPT